MTSAPLAARSARSSSFMSPATNSTCSPGAIGPSPSDDTSTNSPAAARSSRVPTERLSTTLTAWPPSSARDRIKAVPIKPQPPVMSQFTKTAPLGGEDHLSSLSSSAYPSLPSALCAAHTLDQPPLRRESSAEGDSIRYNLRRLVRCSRRGLVDGREDAHCSRDARNPRLLAPTRGRGVKDRTLTR